MRKPIFIGSVINLEKKSSQSQPRTPLIMITPLIVSGLFSFTFFVFFISDDNLFIYLFLEKNDNLFTSLSAHVM